MIFAITQDALFIIIITVRPTYLIILIIFVDTIIFIVVTVFVDLNLSIQIFLNIPIFIINIIDLLADLVRPANSIRDRLT
jgi:hypothetical protein